MLGLYSASLTPYTPNVTHAYALGRISVNNNNSNKNKTHTKEKRKEKLVKKKKL